MNSKKISCVFVWAVFVLGALVRVGAQTSEYKISAPVSYKNLSVFLIHGRNQIDHENILTLQEAMEKNLLVVYETSDVNSLTVENKSAQFEVFIQSGDIVKGGKQDRILGVDVIIPTKSGKISIEAFCVESGRWTQRGGESSGQFTSSKERIVSKDLKLAANKERSQGEVWKKVGEAQDKLSDNVGTVVNSGVSKTSLQLSLENRKVVETTDEYVKNLLGILENDRDVIGFAFVINGRINSADIYASSFLFKKLWPKLLKATAVEAISELNNARNVKLIKISDIRAFLEGADRGKSEERTVTARMKMVTRESKDDVVFEAYDEKSKAVIHRGYVKKP